MKFLKLIPIIFIFLGIFPSSKLVYAEGKDPNSYKVLSNNNKKLTITNVQAFIIEGDAFVENGNFDEAKNSYDKARDLAKQLAGFYRDLNGAFKGLDARIPDETGDKGRESIKMWAKSNARLAALYKRKNQPDKFRKIIDCHYCILKAVRRFCKWSHYVDRNFIERKHTEAYRSILSVSYLSNGAPNKHISFHTFLSTPD